MHKRLSITFLYVLMSILGFSQTDYRPAVESFESEKILQFYDTSNSNLEVSNTHYRFGKNALQWNWNGDSSFGTSHFKILSKEESPLSYGDHFPSSPTLQMSIYNEIPQYEKISISFEKDGKTQVRFDLEISFKGWRRIWVPFYEMQGNPPKKGNAITYDYFKISTTSNSGKLFFDDIIFSQYQDDRHQYPDEIVPFIKANTNLGSDHWMPLSKNYNRIKYLKTKPISKEVKMDLQQFQHLIDQDLTIDKKYSVYIDSLKDDFKKLKIIDNGHIVVGPPLTFKEEQEYYDEKQQDVKVFNDVDDLGKVLKKLSNFHARANPDERKEIEEMFLLGTKYFLDQGWQVGASGGTRHHIGYNVREIAESFFTMRQLINDNGLLNDVGSSLHWLFNLGMLLEDEANFHVNIDYLNTQSYYHLMLIFLLEDQEKQATILQTYSNYLSITLAQQNEEWGFKVDGTSWHHNGHYPAYGFGAFQTVPKVINTLSGTRFRIKTEGHSNFKKALLTTRMYSQLYNWGFGNAGRHPLEDGGIAPLRESFLQMAYAGNPEGTSKIDKDVASAYLRLWGKDDDLNSPIFAKTNGIQAEKLSGFQTLPYAATAIHRRNDWAAIIKGYSKYVWASEIYVNENRYGRYPSNGTVQLLNSDGEKGSGFYQEGWDWNCYPGATVIYLPFKELEPEIPLLMFRSNETFAGTTELDGNGIFGMILNEDQGSNAEWPGTKAGYPGKLKAKKSIFSFGDKLICIGTNISSIDDKNSTQTNLFQSFLTDTKTPLLTSAKPIKKFPYQTVLNPNSKNRSWLIDPYGNGYHILSNTPVQIKKVKQQSYHNKYSINTGSMNPKGKGAKETEGNYATAWIDHGLAPNNASYQYAIYPFLNEDEQKGFGKKVKKEDPFVIQRADSIAHIVLDKNTDTTGYVAFASNKNLEHGILKDVSEPALIMIREDNKNHLTISVVQPDLNFSEIKKGKYKNYSTPVELTITLKGKWRTTNADFITNIDNTGTNSKVTLNCIDGLPRVFKMNKL